jgi:hypothetical protein
MSSGAIWQPLAPENLLAADWTAILGQSGNIAIILVVSVISLLLNASALELAFQPPPKNSPLPPLIPPPLRCPKLHQI